MKSKKLMEIAREKAISSRLHDIDCGNDDKVLHAIIAEYQDENGEKKTKKRSKEKREKSIRFTYSLTHSLTHSLITHSLTHS